MLHVSCPYCEADAGETWCRENGWTAVKCRRCGFVYVCPRPDDSEVAESTRLGLHRVESGSLEVRSRFARRRVSGFRKRLKTMFPEGELSRGPVRCLDVGAGCGEFLAALRDVAPEGSTLEGIEPCRSRAAVAAARGLAVSDGRLDSVAGSYDLVSAINVLSHVPDPHAFVAQLGTRLAPGGYLLLVTGNGGDVSAADYPQRFQFPDHLLLAGRRHVVGLLERAGFTNIELSAFRTSLPRMTLIDKAESVLAAVLRRRVGYSGPFRSLWIRATKDTPSPARAPSSSRGPRAGRPHQS